MNRQAIKLFIITLLLTLVFLSSCTGEIQPQTATETTEPMNTETIAPTVTSTKRPTQAPTATPIVFPTYEPVTQDEMVAWLDEKLSQPECDLPCLWGITPGETTVQEAYQIVAPYATDITTFESNTGSNTSGFLFYFSILPYSPGDPLYDFSFNFIEDEIVYLEMSDLRNYSNYSIQNILAQYGPPEEIWMEAWSRDPTWDNRQRYSTFLLYYPSQQFSLEYFEGPDGQIITEDSVISCFTRAGRLVTWVANNADEIKNDYHERYFFREIGPFLQLEDVTGMSPDEFYGTFINTIGEVCIETPLDTWLYEKSGEFD